MKLLVSTLITFHVLSSLPTNKAKDNRLERRCQPRKTAFDGKSISISKNCQKRDRREEGIHRRVDAWDHRARFDDDEEKGNASGFARTPVVINFSLSLEEERVEARLGMSLGESRLDSRSAYCPIRFVVVQRRLCRVTPTMETMANGTRRHRAASRLSPSFRIQIPTSADRVVVRRVQERTADFPINLGINNASSLDEAAF